MKPEDLLSKSETTIVDELIVVHEFKHHGDFYVAGVSLASVDGKSTTRVALGDARSGIRQIMTPKIGLSPSKFGLHMEVVRQMGKTQGVRLSDVERKSIPVAFFPEGEPRLELTDAMKESWERCKQIVQTKGDMDGPIFTLYPSSGRVMAMQLTTPTVFHKGLAGVIASTYGNLHRYVAWTVTMTGWYVDSKPGLSPGELLTRSPSQHPERKEVLSMMGSELNGVTFQQQADILRGPGEPPSFPASHQDGRKVLGFGEVRRISSDDGWRSMGRFVLLFDWGGCKDYKPIVRK